MQAAVCELVDPLEREGVECLQLADARQVEEAVAADLAGHVPEEQAEQHSGSEHPPPAGNPLRPRRAPHERERNDPAPSNRTSASVSDVPTAKVTASAPKRSASDQASVTEAPRSPRARATIAPGHSKIPVASARRTRVIARAAPARAPTQASRGVAVHPAAFVAEQPRAQPQRPAEQPPRTLRVANAAVLGEKPQVAADVLTEHPPTVRRAADVHALGAGEEERPSSRPARSGSTSPSPR